MSKIMIPKYHQKYLQREFLMSSDAGSGILVITQALMLCLI